MPLIFGDPESIRERDNYGRRRTFIKPMPATDAKPKRGPKERVELTDEEQRWGMKLKGCTYLPGSPDKRFVRGFPDAEGKWLFTARQIEYLHRLVYRYRRQMGMKDAEAKVVFERLQAGRNKEPQ